MKFFSNRLHFVLYTYEILFRETCPRIGLNKPNRATRDAPRPFSRVDLLGSHAAQDARGLTGEVGQDDVSASAPQAHERLHHHLLLVDHAQRPAGFDHRVLPRNLNKGPGDQ